MLPASIRTNNPGAQWYGPIAQEFGATGTENLSDGNNAAVFPDPEAGAAAQLALWHRKYSGLPLSAAIKKWSGGNSSPQYVNYLSQNTGISPDTVITPELLSGPQGISLARAQAQWEAGRAYPLSDEGWANAQKRAFGGGAPAVPMSTAFAQNTPQNTTGKPMADYGPALSPAAVAGGPGAMYGGAQPTPLGGFAGLLRHLGVGQNEDIGRKLQNAGAALIAIGNPAGGAALQNAANMPMFRQRFGMTSDVLGNKYIYNNHTGQVFRADGMPMGGPAGSMPPQQDGGQPSRAQSLAQSPVAQAAQAKADQEASGKKMEALEEAATQASSMKDLITQQAMPLSKDPNVAQGAGADARYHAKNWAQTLTLGAYHPKGLEQTADLDKLNQQLVAGNLAAQKGVRFAAPEIKFGQSASADLDKPALTNQQIYSNYLQNAERAIAIRDIARRHMSTHGVLGPEFSREVQKYQEDNPLYQPDAVQPSAATPANRPSLSSFQK